MNKFFVKLRHVFLPFLLISVTTISAYVLVHWLVFIKFELFELDDLWQNFIIPGAVAVIMAYIFIPPIIKRLDFTARKNKSGDPVNGAMIFVIISILPALFIALNCVETKTGKLTTLEHIGSINKQSLTRYYKLKEFYLDKQAVRIYSVFKTSGKYDQNFDMTIYCAVPIRDSLESQPANNVGLNTGRGNFRIDMKKALILVNGKKFSNDSLKYIDPNTVTDVQVINPKASVALYGNAAKYGVVHVIIKDKPIDSGSLAVAENPNAWLAVSYKKTISNDLSPQEKETAYNNFAAVSRSEFNKVDQGTFIYLERLRKSDDLSNFRTAISQKDKSIVADKTILLKPAYEPFESRAGNSFKWIFGSFGIGAFVFFIFIQFFPLRKNHQRKLSSKRFRWLWLNDVKTILWPRTGYVVTPILIVLNITVFFAMVIAGLGFISFSSTDLLLWGADYRPAVMDGDYWRLFTATFLHGGVMHLFLNMYGLMFIGVMLEPVIGSRKFALAYLFAGLAGSAASLWWHPATVGVGASGAIFGMYGVYLALLTTSMYTSAQRKILLTNMVIFIGINLLMGIRGAVDNAAHIGGLVTGIIAGYAVYPFIKQRIDSSNNEQELLHEPEENAV